MHEGVAIRCPPWNYQIAPNTQCTMPNQGQLPQLQAVLPVGQEERHLAYGSTMRLIAQKEYHISLSRSGMIRYSEASRRQCLHFCRPRVISELSMLAVSAHADTLPEFVANRFSFVLVMLIIPMLTD